MCQLEQWATCLATGITQNILRIKSFGYWWKLTSCKYNAYVSDIFILWLWKKKVKLCTNIWNIFTFFCFCSSHSVFSNKSGHENDTTKHCWDWSRTSEKEAQGTVLINAHWQEILVIPSVAWWPQFHVHHLGNPPVLGIVAWESAVRAGGIHNTSPIDKLFHDWGVV